MTTPCPLHMPGLPAFDGTPLCARCGQPEAAHALAPTLPPDPFAAWCRLPEKHRLRIVRFTRVEAGRMEHQIDGDALHAAADALEAIAAGRRL